MSHNSHIFGVYDSKNWVVGQNNKFFIVLKNILLIDLGEIIIPNKGSESNLLGVWRILEEKKMSYLISQT